MLNGILAVLSAIIAAFSFYQYSTSGDNKLYLVVSIIFLIAFLALGAMFLSSRVNKTEDIQHHLPVYIRCLFPDMSRGLFLFLAAVLAISAAAIFGSNRTWHGDP